MTSTPETVGTPPVAPKPEPVASIPPEPVKTAVSIQAPKPEPASPESTETVAFIQASFMPPKLEPAAPVAPEPAEVATPTTVPKPEPVASIQAPKPEPVETSSPEPAKEPEDGKATPRRERLWPWRVLSVLLPIAGVPMAAFWSERRPERSHACLTGSLVGLSVLFVLFTVVTVLGVLGMAGCVTL